MSHTLKAFPLDLTVEEQAAGFRRVVLSLGDYIGPWPGENVEVAARRLSEADILLKCRMISRNAANKVFYRHIRFGYLSWRELIRFLWQDVRFRFWRSWFRGHRDLPWKIAWRHIPFANYEKPDDNCRRTLAWSGVVGHAFHEYLV